LLVLGVFYGVAVSSLFKAFSMAPISVVGPLTAGYPALIVIWGLLHGLSPSVLQYASIIAVVLGSVVVGGQSSGETSRDGIAPGNFSKVLFFCVVCEFCFAIAVVLGQNSSLVFGDYTTAGLLRLPAAVVLLPFAWNEKPERPNVTQTSFLGLVAIAALDVIALSGIYYMGVLPNKELGAMGISAYGGIAVILAMLILKEPVARGQWLGIGLITLGVAGLGVQAG